MSRLNKYMAVNELFDTDVDVKKIKVNKNEAFYEFFIGDKEYTVTMDYYDKEIGWEILFGLDKIGNKKSSSDDGKFGITGTGDAIEVFSGVIKALKMWIKKVKPSKFFSQQVDQVDKNYIINLPNL